VRNLRACLNDEPLPRLMAMADLWDVALDASSAREVAEALSGHMLQPDVAQRVRDELPADAQEGLTTLIKSGGRMPTAAFERRFGAVRPMGPGKLERERPWLNPSNVAEILWYRGLFFRAFDRVGSNPSEMAFVPLDLYPLLGGQTANADNTQKPAAAPAINKSNEATGATAAAHSDLIDDITTILIHIQNTNVVVRTDGEWQVTARRAIAPLMRDGDGVLGETSSNRFRFLLRLIERMGWMRVLNNRARLVPQPVTHWLQLSTVQQREALLNTWLSDNEWNDLAQVPGLSLEMTHTWANQPVRERRAILDLLAQWQANAPQSNLRMLISDAGIASLDEFVAYVKLTNPDFARPDGRYDTWHVRDVASQAFLVGFEHWDQVEGALIRYLITHPLRWLEYANQDELPRNDQPVLLRDNGQAIVSASHPFARFQLGRVADWVSNEAHAFVYRLSPRALTRAAEQGIQAPRVTEFFEKNSGKSLPPNIAKGIQRWAERGSEARLEPMRLLRTKDANTLDMLLSNMMIRRAMVERIAPNGLLIRERDTGDVLAAAAQSGVLLDEGAG